ncbi:MAG: ABC transporter permease [Acetobacteraceae bacterium]
MSAAILRPRRLRLTGTWLVAVIIYIAMFVIYALAEPSASSVFGLANLFNDTVVLAIASAGLTLVVLTGEFDLSPIGIIAIANVVVATTSVGSLGWFGALLAVLVIGAGVGLLNGWLVAALRLQSLAVTIGTMIACEGVALMILAAPGGEVNEVIVNGLTGDLFGVIPVGLVVMLGVLFLWLGLARTRLGVAIYAVGTDENAASLSGFNARRTKLLAFVLSGLTYGFAGFMLSCQTSSGDPIASDTLLLFMYASVAIGGTSLMGGRGGVFGSLVGAGILAVMQKMLFALGAASFYTSVFSGIIMLVAIFFGNLAALLERVRRRSSA